MNVELYIHGVPAAFSQRGTDSQVDMMRFYNDANNVKENIRFSVEVSRIDVKYCVYYTYLRYKNFVDSTGRSGSYFGLTIRTDEEFLRDVGLLYQVCDDIFHELINDNVILTRHGETYQYLIRNFEDQNNYLEIVFKKIFDEIRGFRSASIDPYLVLPNTQQRQQVMTFNLLEVDSEYFWQSLRNAHIIYFSPEYPLKDTQILSLNNMVEPEKNKNRQLTEKYEKLTNESDNLQKKCNNFEREINTLKKENSQKSEKIEALSSELSKLKAEEQNNRARKKIDQLVEQIYEPIKELKEVIKKSFPAVVTEDRDDSSHRPTSSQPTSNLYKKIESCLTFLIIVVIIWICYFQYQENLKLDKLEKEILTLPTKYPKSSELQKSQGNSVIIYERPSVDPKVEKGLFSNQRVDITPDPTNGKLIVGKNYNFKIKPQSGKQPLNVEESTQGKWFISDDKGEICINSNSYSFPKTGSYTIKYKYNNEAVERVINVRDN